MPVATLTRMTADEFLELHVHDRGIELVDGEIVEMPLCGFEHGCVISTTGYSLFQFVRANNLGRMATGSFIRVSDYCVFGADILFISYKLLPSTIATPEGALNPPLELVVEVRSPSDTRKAILNKAREYLAAGVEVAMVVDPKDRTATVLRTGKKQEQFGEADTLTLPDILQGFSVRVGEFFE